MIYLLISNIALAIGFALFHFSFRNLTFFQWNRCYLIGMVFMSLLIPIGIYIDLSTLFQANDVMLSLHLGTMDSVVIYTGKVDTPLYLIDVLYYTYWVGVVASILFTVYRLRQLRNTFKKQDAYSSFSFFRKIVIGTAIKETKAIEAHERVHVREGHSYDIVLMELVSIFNWFNPIVYLIKKELKFQHECIADEICSTDKVLYAELLLAHAMRTDVNALRHEFSNPSFLKKRIMMLFKNKSTNRKKLLYFSTLPLIAVVVLSTLVFNTSKAISSEASFDVNTVKLFEHKYDENHKSILESKYNLSKIQSEINAEPPHGMAAFRKWIGDNYQYPQAAIDAGIKGTIQVSFIIEKDGSLSDIIAVRDLGYGTGEAAVNLLKTSENWYPKIENGKAVRSQYILPIRIDLSSD